MARSTGLRGCGGASLGGQGGVAHDGKTRRKFDALIVQPIDLLMGTQRDHLIALPMTPDDIERIDADRPR